MTYQTLIHMIQEIQEELIQAGFVELIAPYFFANVKPGMSTVASLQQLDQFSYLLSLDEEVLQSVFLERLKPIVIQQMLHTCREASSEQSLRWRLLIQEVNAKLSLDLLDREYQKADIVSWYQQNESKKDFSDCYRIAQACKACGYKNTIPFQTNVFDDRIDCPMCEQDTCCQAI